LKNFEAYGDFVRSFNAATGAIEDEPEAHSETVLTLRLSVGSDLEPTWCLVSDRARGQSRFLSWSDRLRLCPTRIGALADQNLAWRRGSVLNQISDERADASAALAEAAREARLSFGDQAEAQLGETLRIVAATATELGIPVGAYVKALLDAHAVSFGGGTIALHDEKGVPLRSLGTGSTRLLIAGLQRKAAQQSSIVLIDELEHGLEPHRIIRFLDSIGAKEGTPPLQVFTTTHSPVAIRELSSDQLVVIRKHKEQHQAHPIGRADQIQGTIRTFPEAFLASSVIVCEGASEVGLIRGLDRYYAEGGHASATASGVALVDADGCDNLYRRANAFRTLGYRTMVLRDDDKKPAAEVEAAYVQNGGKLVVWRRERALEDELFLSLTNGGVLKLLSCALSFHDWELIEDHIRSASEGKLSLTTLGAFSPIERSTLAKASRSKRGAWFKSVTRMQRVAYEVVGPDLEEADQGFRELIYDLFRWMHDGRE
jgi:putative ATP-dependent endonuclease of OLD family